MRRAALTSVRPTRSGVAEPNRNVGGGGDRDADAGEAENPWIGRLAGQVARALARGVADIAKDEEIADRGAGKACAIDRLAGPKSLHKSPGRTGDRAAFTCACLTSSASAGSMATLRSAASSTKLCARSVSPGGKRRADFALGNVSVKNAIERPIADLDRVIHGEAAPAPPCRRE